MKKITFLLALIISTSAFAQLLSEGFEGNVIPPTGWTVSNTNANQNWQTSTGLSGGGTTISPTEGTYGAVVLYDVNQQDETLTSPTFSLVGATSPELTFDINLSYFWAVSPNDNYDITVSINDGTNTTPVWTENDLGVFTSGQWNNITIDLTSYVGSSISVIINYNGADGDYVMIDNIEVDEAPACDIANGLALTGVTNTTADISWSNAGDFDVEWGEFPYTQGGAGGSTASVTNDSSYQLTGLTPGVSYNLFIRQNCGAGLTSTYEEIVVGTFPDTINSFPSTNDLEPAANQALLLNLGFNFVSGTGNWSFAQDDLTDGDTTNDFATSGVSYVFSNSTFTDAAADATIFFGPYALTAGTQYTFGFQQRNLVVSNATTPNKDIELIAATTNDGTTNTVIATYDDMDNVTSQFRSGTFNPTTSGDYYFAIRDKSSLLTGVAAANVVIVDDVEVTAVLSVEDFNKISVSHFYNQNSNSFNVEVSEGLIEHVELYSLLGQEILQQEVGKATAEINMNNLNQGVYIARVTFNGTTESIKFIKK